MWHYYLGINIIRNMKLPLKISLLEIVQVQPNNGAIMYIVHQACTLRSTSTTHQQTCKYVAQQFARYTVCTSAELQKVSILVSMILDTDMEYFINLNIFAKHVVRDFRHFWHNKLCVFAISVHARLTEYKIHLQTMCKVIITLYPPFYFHIMENITK